MDRNQFHDIKHFSPEEVELTGAKLGSVQRQLMLQIDSFRTKIDCSVKLLKNGMTTGDHKSQEHTDGMATDIVLGSHREVKTVVYAALEAGFTSIGIYHNSMAYSYHLGVREGFAMWSATKKPDGSWKYESLFVDPGNLGG